MSSQSKGSFYADKQTLEDLNLLGKFKPGSLFSLFNKVKTRGGERVLEEMFRHPLSDHKAINERSSLFQYIGSKGLELPFSPETFQTAEGYLSSSTSASSILANGSVVKKKLTASFLRDEGYDTLHKGLIASLQVLTAVKSLLKELDIPQVKEAKEILSDKRLGEVLGNTNNASLNNTTSLPLLKLASLDYLLRGRLHQEMEVVLSTIYQLDVLIAISKVGKERGFSYAKALPKEAHSFKASHLRHPALDKGVANAVSLDSTQNLIFLTGANMAGKSTIMKSLGIGVYMAHMGFPVAGGELEFSVLDGLYCSINVSDNLSQGYSHYYAEVLRVKEVATAVAEGKSLIVIFDELFKGTNVKDAYDATLACTKAFSKYRSCLFVVSTHIIEVGEALKDGDNIQFRYMPTIIQGSIPKYTYHLTVGITEDRQGMIIIQNEGIIEMLKG